MKSFLIGLICIPLSPLIAIVCLACTIGGAITGEYPKWMVK